MKLRTHHFLIAGLAVIGSTGVTGYLVLTQQEPEPVSVLPAANKPETASAWGASPFGVKAADLRKGRRRMFMMDDQTVAVYGRNGRIVDFGGVDAATYIAKWSSRARTGDTAAAYKVFQATDACANNNDAIPEFQDTSERTEFLRERTALEKLCVGITPAQIQERMNFLSMAAHAGNADAQIDFYMEGPYGRPLNPTEGADDPAVAKWKEDAVTYLKAASEQRQPFALALLSLAYDVGELVPQDAKMSLAYTVADATARNVALSPQQLRNRFGNQMSDEDFANALQMGAQIANNCCKKQ